MRRRLGARSALAAGVIVLVTGAGIVGYLIGHGSRRSDVLSGPGLVYATPIEGTAYLGADEPLNRQPRGFAYTFNPGVEWSDANGEEHMGDARPACVPYYHPVRVKALEVVRFRDMGTVTWVQC